jgi:ParB family chromosome partitioning protein
MSGTTVLLPRTAITVGERVRDDYGDLESLARSLSRWGMLFPVLVDQHHVLCDGGRRLRAAAIAGLDTIPATIREMTEDERRELELEVDIEHKSLTAFERNKRLVAQAEAAAAALRAKAEEIDAPGASISKRGPKAKGGVKREDIADAAGVKLRTLQEAEQHVAAVAEFPDLAPLPQKTAIRQARKNRMANDPGAKEREIERDLEQSKTRLAKAFSSKLPHLQELTRLKPEALADALTDEHWRQFTAVEGNAQRWFDEMKRARSRGLRLLA